MLPGYVSAQSVSNGEIIELLQKEFGDLMPHFYQIVKCESSFRQEATHLNENKTIDYGLLQVNSTHREEAKELDLDFINSARDNIKMARIIFEKQGYGAWLNCSTKLGLI